MTFGGYPVPDTLESRVVGNRIVSVRRRAKYILIEFSTGHMLLHLGMSGSMQRLSSRDEPPGVHDHVELEISNDLLLRLRDSRRFGCVLWIEGDPAEFHLLANLGPEPLSEDFDGEYLYAISRNRKLTVKNMIMNSRVVVRPLICRKHLCVGSVVSCRNQSNQRRKPNFR